jgi:hypothetical protein
LALAFDPGIERGILGRARFPWPLAPARDRA